MGSCSAFVPLEEHGDEAYSEHQAAAQSTSPTGHVSAVELKELRDTLESMQNQIRSMDKHWNDKMETLRLELTDLKYMLHTKPSHDDVQAVKRRCEEYGTSSEEKLELLRNDVLLSRQDLSRQDQDLDNNIERLRRRVEEIDFDAMATRLTLIEAKVSQVHSYVPHGPEPSLKHVAAKMLNVLFALVALVLLFCTTAISMAAPFIRTR